jgi:hypothetical protein
MPPFENTFGASAFTELFHKTKLQWIRANIATLYTNPVKRAAALINIDKILSLAQASFAEKKSVAISVTILFFHPF